MLNVVSAEGGSDWDSNDERFAAVRDSMHAPFEANVEW